MAAGVQSQRGASGKQDARKQADNLSPLTPSWIGSPKRDADSDRGKNTKQTSRGQAGRETRIRDRLEELMQRRGEIRPDKHDAQEQSHARQQKVHGVSQRQSQDSCRY